MEPLFENHAAIPAGCGLATGGAKSWSLKDRYRRMERMPKNPKIQVALPLILAVFLFFEGVSMIRDRHLFGPTTDPRAGIVIGIPVLVGAPCFLFLAWQAYRKLSRGDKVGQCRRIRTPGLK